MGKTLRNLVGGAVILGALASGVSCYDSGSRSTNPPVPTKPKVVKPEKGFKDLGNVMKVRLDGGEIVELKNNGQGVFEGRESEFLGHKIIRVSYDADSKKSEAYVKIKGFIPRAGTSYSLSSDKYIRSMTGKPYTLSSNGGKELEISVIEGPYPKSEALEILESFTDAFLERALD